MYFAHTRTRTLAVAQIYVYVVCVQNHSIVSSNNNQVHQQFSTSNSSLHNKFNISNLYVHNYAKNDEHSKIEGKPEGNGGSLCCDMIENLL